MAKIAFLVIGFIIYGSLYPFEFRPRADAGGPVGYLLTTWRDWDARGDLISNILLYMPFGFFATLSRARPGLHMRHAGAAILAATALSVGIELTQYYDVGRVTSMGDVYANAIGAAVGAIGAAALGAGVQLPLVGELAATPDCMLLLAMFLGYRLFPYVPTIDLHKYWHAVRDCIVHPLPAYSDMLRFTLTWLFIASLIDAVYGFRRWLVLFPLFAAGELAGRVLIIDAAVQPADVLGACAGFLLWAVAPRRLKGRDIAVTVLFGVLVVVQRLQPFSFSASPLHAFGWIPFLSLMSGSISVAILSFCEKFYQYGGMIWLLTRTGMTPGKATGLTTALLLGTSYAEIYLPDRSGEVTDAVMAIMVGGAFRLLRQA
jgi:VanZ family protein